MHRRPFIVLLLLPLFTFPLRASDTTRPETDEPEEPVVSQESEAKGIIPEGGLTASTQPITPIAFMPEKNPYDQALEELAIAEDLAKKGRVEAASDVALQAYDDLMAIYIPRRNKPKRKKLLAERHRAATVYIETSLAYIQEYADKQGKTSSAMVEGHARAADLRDVSVNYPELNRKVSLALQRYAMKLSSPTAR